MKGVGVESIQTEGEGEVQPKQGRPYKITVTAECLPHARPALSTPWVVNMFLWPHRHEGQGTRREGSPGARAWGADCRARAWWSISLVGGIVEARK